MAPGSRPERNSRACPAKVNLFLEVLGRRADGYHEVETLLAEIDLRDEIHVERIAAGLELRVEGDPSVPAGPENLVHRAARAVLSPEEGARIRLVKRIPAGAGLGGGSSDAAGTLLALDTLYGLRERGVDLAAAAASLGSDVPFFLHGGVAIGRGRGEIVEPIPGVPPLELILFLPPLPLATASVYAGLTAPLTPRRGGARLCAEALRRGEVRGMAGAFFNRLEEPAFSLYAGLTKYRDRIVQFGYAGVHLSGSGSALFALAGSRAATLSLGTEWPELRTLRVRAVGSSPPAGAEGAPGGDH